MPSGSISHQTERPDVNKRHAKHATNFQQSPDNSEERGYDEEMAAQFEPAFGIVPGRAYGDAHLTAFQFRVFALMCGYANRKDHICWPKQETLAKILHTSVKVVSKIIVQLIKLGYVEVSKSGFPARNVYRIIWEEPLQKPLASYLPATESTPQTTLLLATESTPQQTLLADGVRVHRGVDSYNIPIEHTSKSLRTLRDLHDDGDGETRVDVRSALIEKIVSAGNLPRQTNRAALAQLIAAHPQISAGEWEYQAAAAAEWFSDHQRRLTLASFASWITRYLREQQQLAEQESSDERPAQHRGSHGRRQTARKPHQPSSGTVPHTPENDVWEPLDDSVILETEDERILRLLRARSIQRDSDPAGRN